MTWSLKLNPDGDLSLGGKGLGTVTNEAKLVQDLRCELLEKKGTNKFNPDFGSSLDEDLIANSETVQLDIESHISEVVGKYQTRQLNRAKLDKLSWGKATLTPAEVLLNYSIADIAQYETTVSVNVLLTTAAHNPNSYPIPLTLSL
jgi:hypothetical protein